MTRISENIDADTVDVSDETGTKRIRIAGVNTAESTAKIEARNTPEGEEASRRAKLIVPKGQEVQTTTFGKDKFGKRHVGDLKIQTAQGEVDYGLLLADQGMSTYTTKYGEHPDPEQHDVLKEYYSEDAPYQYADSKKPLTPEDYNRVATNIANYRIAEEAFNDGDISREDYEKAMFDAYGKPEEVARYRYQNKDWQRKFDMRGVDGTARMAFDWANQSQENKDKYDRAVRNSHNGHRKNPERSLGFWSELWKDTKTTFSMLNDFAVVGRAVDYTNARDFGDEDAEFEDVDLLRNVPPEWHATVLKEQEDFGGDVAMQYRENLLIALENEREMEDMPLVTQIATAIPALVTSPVTLFGGGAVAKGGVAVSRTIDATMKVGRVKNLAIPAKVATWAAVGSIDAGISATPRYALEDTFTSRDMLNEMKYGALFGAAVPAGIAAVKGTHQRVTDHTTRMNEVQKLMQQETDAWVEAGVPIMTPVVVRGAPLNKLAFQGNVATDLLDPNRPQTTIVDGHVVDTGTGEVLRPVAESRVVVPLEEVDTLAASELHASQTTINEDGFTVDAFGEVLEEPPVKLQEEDLTYLDNADNDVPQAPKPAPVVKKLRKARKLSRKVLTEAAEVKISTILKTQVADKPQRGKVSATVDAATGTLTKSFTQTMRESTSTVANWIGDKLLESPEGLGGKKLRGHSAALEQHQRKTRYLTQTQPSYHKLIGEYAAEHGKRGFGKFMAQHMDGQNNALAKRFSRDIATVLEQRRQGRPITITSPSTLRMVDELELSMGKMYDDLVESGVAGFQKERRIKNYFPQLWDDTGVQRTIKQYGRDRVQQLLAKGYMNSKHNNINSLSEAMHVADNFLANQAKGEVADGALPSTIDSRARERLDVDTTVTDGDLSLMDLLETDFSTVTAKYANRAAGKVALANKGITSDLDQAVLRDRMWNDGATESEMKLFDDAFDIIMGRPTRNGLPEFVREIKDAVSLSKMGGLGMAQAAEGGTVIARSLLHLVSDPKTFKKIWAMAGESTDNVELMRETQALSSITNEVHLLDRQAVHLDQNELRKIGGIRDIANWVAGKASFGKWKAPAGYILSQGSGFNMIRRFERRLANASFMLDTAKTFKDGTGKMSRERMLDIGLDPDDKVLKNIFKNVVEYDENGIVKKLNIDKWDRQTLEKYQLAMYRDDAQMVQQTIGGEMPAWINKPAMTVIAQFKQQAILANKKQLTRQAQFADREAVLATMLNTTMAGLTRTAKFGTLGAAAYAVTGDESELQKPWEKDYWQPEKYVSTFGFFPDMLHIGLDSAEAIQEERVDLKTVGDGIAGEIPMVGWMKDYYDVAAGETWNEKAEAAKGVAILGNMQWADTLYKGLEAQLND